MKRFALFASVLVFVAAFAACGSGSGGGASDADLPPNYVVVKALKFTPKTLTVAPGDEITFDFDDGSVQHNAVAEDKSFDTGIHTETTVTVTLNKPGRYPYVCTLHPTMKGTIIVEEGAGPGTSAP